MAAILFVINRYAVIDCIEHSELRVLKQIVFLCEVFLNEHFQYISLCFLLYHLFQDKIRHIYFLVLIIKKVQTYYTMLVFLTNGDEYLPLEKIPV